MTMTIAPTTNTGIEAERAFDVPRPTRGKVITYKG